MAAWQHKNYWNLTVYRDYRSYVTKKAESYEGNETYDCADISIKLIVDFAQERGLPITFCGRQSDYASGLTLYCSKAGVPFDLGGPLNISLRYKYKWNTKDEYFSAVKTRINAAALFLLNTQINPNGPEEGDLMLRLQRPSGSHAALVYRVWPPGTIHPRATDRTIKMFPGANEAAKQLSQTRYFRMVIGPPTEQEAASKHFDYLNHRGVVYRDPKDPKQFYPIKQKAELIMFADPQEFRKDGFQFRMYAPWVLENWSDWTGVGRPSRFPRLPIEATF